VSKAVKESGHQVPAWVAIGVVALLSAGVQVRAESAVFRRADRRHLPAGWTRPELTVSPSTGAKTFKPSVPDDFDERETGGVLDVGAVTVHVNSIHGRVPRAESQLRLIGRDGRGVTVKAGIWTPVNGRFLRIIIEDGSYFLESLSPRHRWRMLRARD